MEIINDEYWLSYAKKSVENSITSRNHAAAKIEAMTLWFWGAYVLYFTIGVTIELLDVSSFVMFLLALPIVLVMVTYWLCVYAQLPVTVTFDPRIPSEILEGYNSGLRTKNRRFQFSLLFTFLSAVSVAIALYMLSISGKKEDERADLLVNDSKDMIILSAQMPKNRLVSTMVDSISAEGHKSTFFTKEIKTGTTGQINLNIPVNRKGKSAYVATLTWKDGDIRKGLVRMIQ